MNVMLSTAAGLLAADAFYKKRRRSRKEASTASDSSSDASSAPCAPRKARSPSLSSQDSQTSSSTLEPSISSESSSEASTSSSGSGSDSESSSDESRAPNPRRLTQRNLQRHRHRQESVVPRPRHRSTLVPYRPLSPLSSTSTDSDSEYSSSYVLRRSPRRDSLHQHPPPLPPRPRGQQPDHNAASSLHSRVSNFLPAIRASNDLLQQTAFEERDIEILNDAEGKYIEMNLGLGVLEEQGKDSPEIRIQKDRAGESLDRAGKENTPLQEHHPLFHNGRGQHIESLDHQAQRATCTSLYQPGMLEERSPGLSTKRERSRESLGRLSRQHQEDGGDFLGALMGRDLNRAMTPEMRERKRRRVGIEVL
ncbi:MAG: hypothetical protein Q9174_005537 [Haloplaca sp. 1 TL-2023]